ncbi:MAG: leucine-rich repeat domain-containing protein [Cyclobacteriaceae bacterium]
MKKPFLILFIVICCLNLVAQQRTKAYMDSLAKVYEQHHIENMKKRDFFVRKMKENPKGAMDSIVLAKKKENKAWGLERLKQLSNNQRLDTLKEIDLSYAGLKEIPDFVYDAKNLKILVLDYNEISKLPRRLSELEHLKRIYWRSNNLGDLTRVKIRKIGSIEKLDLSYNTLTKLPRSLRKIDDMGELVLDENLFEEVPIKRLSKADFVNSVSFNKCNQIELGEGRYDKLSFLEVFKANKCLLKSIDPSFFEMKGLEELQLQENEIQSVPEGISKMSGLKKLSFYKNQLSSLPDDFFNIPNLEVIDLYFNKLEVISGDLGNFKNLKILYLSNNLIYSLPESLGKLGKLKELYLHHNRLSVLPAEIKNLKKLRVLRVNENYLSDFPKEILNLNGLEQLDISTNQLTDIPLSLEELKNLKLFAYDDNNVDFHSATGNEIVSMILRISERGVICTPRISLMGQ